MALLTGLEKSALNEDNVQLNLYLKFILGPVKTDLMR